MEKVAIIIPAYNEEKRIGKTLERYGEFFTRLRRDKIIDLEIIVVINNTKDKTEEIVKEYGKKYKIIRYLNFIQGGKGFAIIEGFKYSLKYDFDLIGFVDADMSTSPEEFYKLIKNINNYDGIIASRYVKGAVVNPKQTIKRIIVSRIFNFLLRVLFLFKFRDTQCGAKIFKKNSINKVINAIAISQWAFDVDLIYQIKKNKFKIVEFPTIWEDRSESKLNLKKASIQMFFATFRLRILTSPLRIFWKIISPLSGVVWKLIK